VRDDGFTLIEVIAALMIFSFGIVGLIGMNTQSVRTVNILEDRFVASVVADNVIVEARRAQDIRLGSVTGEEEAMGRNFEWEQEIETTELEGFFKITVRVREGDQEAVIAERTAFRAGENP